MIDTTTELLKEELFFELNVFYYFIVTLIDNSADLNFGHSFLDDFKNELHAVRNWLFERLQADLTIRKRFFKKKNNYLSSSSFISNQLFCSRQSQINEYLLIVQRFLRLISVLMYWTLNFFSRRKELLGLVWCNYETARNFYIFYGMMVFITGYHKSFWRIDYRFIARFFFSAVGQLLIRYFIFVFAFVCFFSSCMQFLCSNHFFFSEGGKVWLFDRFGNLLKRQSVLALSYFIISC